MYRIDPWIVGMAARRLEFLRNRPELRFRLGVYAWVDGPILGAPGPTEGGLIHAPSYVQALTAAILRDKDISERLEAPAVPGGRDLWSMQLELRRIRLAEELASEVRLGSHIYEVLGRQVERIVGVRDAAWHDRRRHEPRGRASQDVPDEEGSARSRPGLPWRRCACRFARRRLTANVDDAGAAPRSRTTARRARRLRRPACGGGGPSGGQWPHRPSRRRDGCRRGNRAPADARFFRNSARGDGLSAAALCAIPFHPSFDPNAERSTDASPSRLADASVAAALESFLGAAGDWTWIGERDGEGGGSRTTTLDELGLQPVDTLALSPGLLDDLARAAMDLDALAPLGGTGRQRHSLARDIVRAFGSEPAFLRDLLPTNATALQIDEVREVDASILEELNARYGALLATAQLMVDELKAAREANDHAAIREALFRALRWGVTPLAERDQLRMLCLIITRGIFPEDPAQVLSFCERAEQSLGERLAAAPAVGSGEPMGRAIAELAAPGGQLAVLSRITASTLCRIGRLDVSAPDATLDAEWLTVVASVRPRLAWIETLQLQALPFEDGAAVTFRGFDSWSSAPGDPWLTEALASLKQRRLQPDGTIRGWSCPDLLPPTLPGRSGRRQWALSQSSRLD